MGQIKEKILGGIAWSVANQIGLQVLSIVFIGILSRLLLPSEFGLVAMVTLATNFLNVLKDFGFGAALVQKKEVTQEEYSSVFWFNILIGVVLTTGVWLAAPLVASFYQEPILEIITKAISFTFLITSASIVLNNMLIKQMEFRQIFYRSLLSTLISGITAVVLAFLGYGYWALIAQVYLNLITMLLFTYLRLNWRPSFILDTNHIKKLMPFSLPLIGDQSLNYWTRNIDNLLIGRVFGTTELAFYTKAYSLMLLPVRQISGTITKVLFPSFSLIQGDIEQIRRIYLKISGVIALVSFPLMTYLYIMGEEVILILLGKQWLESVPIFKILCFLGMIQSIGTLIGNIFISQGKTSLLFRIGLVSRAMMITGIIVGLYMGGVKGVALGYLLSSSTAFILETYFVGRILKTSVFRIFWNLANTFFCTLFMGLAIYSASLFMPNVLLVRIIISTLVAALAYLFMLIVTNNSSFKSLIKLANEHYGYKIFSSKSR